MSGSQHVIVGAGPIGSQTARLLSESGVEVQVVTRSGSGPTLPGVTLVRADASDSARLAEITNGAEVIYNCANPPYHQWASQWPPLAASLLAAAERHNAVLVTASNLYGYGRVSAPMTEATALNPVGTKGQIRTQMWRDALAAHEAGRVRVTEVRAADYVGRDSQSHLGDRVVPRVLAGKAVRVLGNADQPHSWSYVDDVATLLVTVGRDERAWGRPWHVPSNAPRTQREAINDLARVAGVPAVKVGVMPTWVLSALGLFNPTIRELGEVGYQTELPFILDSSAAESTFGLTPTPWEDVMSAIVDYYRSLSGQAAA